MADEKDLSTQAAENAEKSDKAGKAKDGKSARKKGPGLGKRIVKYFKDLKGEFKKIIWPTFPSVVRNTGVTLAVCAVLGVIVFAIDFGLGYLVNLLVSRGG